MIKLLVLVVVGYGLMVTFLYVAQRALVFPGMRKVSIPLDQPRAPERLQLTTADGEVLHGMLYRGAPDPSDLVIGFGGNAQDAEILGQDLAARLPHADVVAFHYRGFGPSTGQPGEQALLADGIEIYDAMVAKLQPARTFAAGISLGSGVATYLSTVRPVAGLILVTPFDSVEAVAQEQYPWVPVSFLLRHRFPSAALMQQNQTPAAVIAVEGDHVVKPARTAALREAIPNLVFDRTLSGASHASIHELPAYAVAFEEAFAALSKAPPALPSPAARATQ